jgi:hypothetical protein
VDNIEDAGDETLPSPVVELALLAPTLRNAANVLVIELASIWETFVWFYEHVVVSLDKMMEVLVKEQVTVQRDHFAAFKLLEQVMEAQRDHCQGRWRSF